MTVSNIDDRASPFFPSVIDLTSKFVIQEFMILMLFLSGLNPHDRFSILVSYSADDVLW